MWLGIDKTVTEGVKQSHIKTPGLRVSNADNNDILLLLTTAGSQKYPLF